MAAEQAVKQLVLHVYQDFHPKRGGIEDHIMTLARTASDAYQHAVLVGASDPVTRHETANNVPVVRVASLGRYYAPFCPTMPLWIRRLSPSIVHLHHPCPTAFVACLLARPPVPVVVGYHNDIVKPRSLLKLYVPWQRAILRRADAILVGTRAYLDTSPYLIPFRAKCRVVPYGIPLEPFAPGPESQERSARMRATYGSPIVLFVGRLCYYKGLDVAVAAMQKVNATLLVVGQGPLASDVRRQAQAHNLTDRVILVGPVDDVSLSAYYRACDLLILPSTYRSEAFGLVMLQAQACARPVICSDLPGLSTVNVDHQTGLLVPPGDAAALADAINYLLTDPSLCHRMGQAGRRQVERLYTAELMSQRIEQLYGALTS